MTFDRDNIKVIILAGGFGSRLGDETQKKPKPMINIGGMPIIWHIMKFYSSFGFNNFIHTLGYKGGYIKNYFMNYKRNITDTTIDLATNQITYHNNNIENWKIHFLDTGLDTETGGRIKKAMEFAPGKRIMATYGDGLSNVNISELLRFHKSHGKLATLTAVRPPSRFGEINLDNNQVLNFKEKNQIGTGWINGGFFILEPEVIEYIPSYSTPFERYPLETLSEKGELMAYKHKGFWQPMDVKREKDFLEKLWSEDNPPWKIW